MILSPFKLLIIDPHWDLVSLEAIFPPDRDELNTLLLISASRILWVPSSIICETPSSSMKRTNFITLWPRSTESSVNLSISWSFRRSEALSASASFWSKWAVLSAFCSDCHESYSCCNSLIDPQNLISSGFDRWGAWLSESWSSSMAFSIIDEPPRRGIPKLST